jgi:hypothetical protein
VVEHAYGRHRRARRLTVRRERVGRVVADGPTVKLEASRPAAPAIVWGSSSS